MDIVERFIGYARRNTQSDPTVSVCPSSAGQMAFARELAEELRRIGVPEVSLSDNGYVMAWLPGNAPGPAIGFIAHMDTSPDAPGGNVNPQMTKNYSGGAIELRDGVRLSPEQFPELLDYKGDDIITSDGTTLLGADDKAGIAAIMTALETLTGDPTIRHPKICVGFTPDEEIGRGADLFDVSKFGAQFAYTIDGGAAGEIEYETFNAAEARVSVTGLGVHPGSAFGVMKNAALVAAEFARAMPHDETPAKTKGYEGFYHLTYLAGNVEEANLNYIIRDFDRQNFEGRKQRIFEVAKGVNQKHGEGTVTVTVKDQYYNMRERIEPVMHIVEAAKEAVRRVGLEPRVQPVRGGTDGSRLSFMGLPTPNIFAGGHNFHSRCEFLPVGSLRKAAGTIIELCKHYAGRDD